MVLVCVSSDVFDSWKRPNPSLPPPLLSLSRARTHTHSLSNITSLYCTSRKLRYQVRHLNPLSSSSVTTVKDTQTGKSVNEMRHPNNTNVHTHGLHIDPAVDNVMLHAAPGETLTYAYTIPEDHMAGTHWYHSHNHGSSALQVMGGLVGAIVVEPTTATIEQMPEAYTAMDEHLLVFTHISLCSCNPTTDPFRIIDYQEYMSSTGDTMSLSAEVGADGISDVYVLVFFDGCALEECH
jgi:hypothetical protein